MELFKRKVADTTAIFRLLLWKLCLYSTIFLSFWFTRCNQSRVPHSSEPFANSHLKLVIIKPDLVHNISAPTKAILGWLNHLNKDYLPASFHCTLGYALKTSSNLLFISFPEECEWPSNTLWILPSIIFLLIWITAISLTICHCSHEAHLSTKANITDQMDFSCAGWCVGITTVWQIVQSSPVTLTKLCFKTFILMGGTKALTVFT